ncbi:hypothetical protein M9H77_18401 [Catharanthus roseus]|uniref:Uncharacterized protein n=1 Tax=Catharanthus roseus TaxID=4058 RepID=A0ACC0B7E6_CATRO|nr:hypothetical protein M9H77_18401 [Catharanthus roseus]
MLCICETFKKKSAISKKNRMNDRNGLGPSTHAGVSRSIAKLLICLKTFKSKVEAKMRGSQGPQEEKQLVPDMHWIISRILVSLMICGMIWWMGHKVVNLLQIGSSNNNRSTHTLSIVNFEAIFQCESFQNAFRSQMQKIQEEQAQQLRQLQEKHQKALEDNEDAYEKKSADGIGNSEGNDTGTNKDYDSETFDDDDE